MKLLSINSKGGLFLFYMLKFFEDNSFFKSRHPDYFVELLCVQELSLFFFLPSILPPYGSRGILK